MKKTIAITLCLFLWSTAGPVQALDQDGLESFVKNAWSWEEGQESAIIKALSEFITIPNSSSDFDPEWTENGHMDKAVDLLVSSVEELKKLWGGQGCKIDDITIGVMGHRDAPETDPATGKRRTPLIYINIPAFGPNAPESSILFYGHMDKQPEMLPWGEGLGPRTPVIRDNRLYGRGGADDGYAIFSAFTAVMALRAQNIAHARCLIIIESDEESGSKDLIYYIQRLKDRIGPVSLIVCLDSGSGNYDQLWITNSLRGLLNAWLEVRVLNEGVHSGLASGIVPGSFRIMRQLLSRLENETTGEITPPWLKADIPAAIMEQAGRTAAFLGDRVHREFPFADEKIEAVSEDIAELLINRTWRSQLAVTGIQGLPVSEEAAGNVLLPYTRAKLSLRLPPALDAGKAAEAILKELTGNPPYNALVSLSEIQADGGWVAPPTAPWLENALREASIRYFRTDVGDRSREALYMGEGGSIPFMGLLGEMFPEAQFVVTGVLGPNSNAHGPDEFLDLPYVQKVTMCVAQVIFDHYEAMRIRSAAPPDF